MSLFSEEPRAVEFAWKGQKYTLLFDMLALYRFEQRTKISPLDVIDHLDDIAKRRARPLMGMLADLIIAGLVGPHPDIGIEQAMHMATDPGVLGSIVEGYAEAMPQGDGVAADPSAPAGGKRKAAAKGKAKAKGGTGTR